MYHRLESAYFSIELPLSGCIPITQSLNVAAHILDANSMTATLYFKNSSAALNKD